MEKLTLEEISEAINGEIYKKGTEYDYTGVSTDTRKIKKGNIFIALRGDNFNGNEYALEAFRKGALLCIVDEVKFSLKDIKDSSSIIIVKDTRKALLDLAKYYRKKLSVKIIGITGSTGKTSTKDLVAAALGSKFKVFKTIGNYNNEIGLPLMIFKIDNTYDVAVLEMGMSNFGEIHYLADTARPDIAIITNVGLSHVENLKSRENILKAKLEITHFFNSDNILIVNNDNDLLSEISSNRFKIIRVGIDSIADYMADNIHIENENIKFNAFEYNSDKKVEFKIDILGKHNVSNSLLAIACGRLLNIEYKDLVRGIKNVEVTSMRLDVTKGKKFTIIDDSYNASPDSMKAALDVLCSINCKRRIAVLGTMGELGDQAYEAHKEIGNYVRNKNIDCFISLSDFNDAYYEGFTFNNDNVDDIYQFENYDDLVEFLTKNIEKRDAVLVKASRAMKFESIVNELKSINY